MKNKLFSWVHFEVPPTNTFPLPTFLPSSIWEESLTGAALSSFATP